MSAEHITTIAAVIVAAAAVLAGIRVAARAVWNLVQATRDNTEAMRVMSARVAEIRRDSDRLAELERFAAEVRQLLKIGPPPGP